MNAHRVPITPLLCGLLAAPASGQAGAGAPWDSVGKILQAPVAAAAGAVRYNLPRTDLTVRVGDVVVAPAIALVGWAGFATMGSDTVAMGDLVVTGAELGPVLRQLAADRIAVTAIHNHLAGEEPSIRYVHFMETGPALDLAVRLRRVFALTGTPVPVRPSLPAPPVLDTAEIFRMLGVSGRANGSVVLMGFNFVPAGVTIGDVAVPAPLGYGSPINLQAVSAARVVATGDFAVPGDKVAGIVAALAAGGITATAMHSHLVGESPTLYYIHFWADGQLQEVLRGLRAVIDAAR
ncbi:MAG: DUF1259 domain-containing protein [Gemmatimonadetes bacterium]|nr:DUF1259 domain-containing protein [Gemmatimonadota bacterium]